jgi:hypothetical protein
MPYVIPLNLFRLSDISPYFFRGIKAAVIRYLPSNRLNMSTRKRSLQPKGGFTFPGGEGPTPKSKRLVKAPEFDTCNYYNESVGLKFDPQRVLLRRVFFLIRDRSKYVSVGFYPALDYQPLLEFGGSQNKPIFMTPDVAESLSQHLPRVCNSMCGNEHYAFREGLFRLTTIGTLKTARMYFDKHYLHFELVELQYLDKIFPIVNNQLKAYVKATPDVKTYVISALGTDLCRTCSNCKQLYPVLSAARRNQPTAIVKPCSFSVLAFCISINSTCLDL